MQRMIKNYVIEKELGRGWFGVAYLVTNKNDSKRYAIKQINLNFAPNKEIENAFIEAQVLKSLVHENIVKYIDSFYIGKTFYIVTEYCERGDLSHFIEKYKNEGKILPEKIVIRLFSQICRGLSFAHSKNIIHRDLKPQNIFLTKDLGVKIGDFGLAKNIEYTYAKTNAGTEAYMAPELHAKNPCYGRKADVWSLGCILLKLCSRNFEFNGLSFVLQGKYNDLPRHISIYTKDIIKKMVQLNPDDRPYVDDILARVSSLESSLFGKNIIKCVPLEYQTKIDYDYEEDEIYFTCSCPGIGYTNTKIYSWIHPGCGGFLKLNCNGKLRCPKCGFSEKVINCTFDCGNHPLEKKLECDWSSIVDSLSLASKFMKTNNSRKFIKNFLINVSNMLEENDE